MTRLRWGAEAPSDNDAARERLIDAAEACFLRYGVMKTTVVTIEGPRKRTEAQLLGFLHTYLAPALIAAARPPV